MKIEKARKAGSRKEPGARRSALTRAYAPLLSTGKYAHRIAGRYPKYPKGFIFYTHISILKHINIGFLIMIPHN